MTNLGDILRISAKLYPNHIAIQEEHTCLSYVELLNKAIVVAKNMQKKGVQSGMAVLIYGKKSHEMIAAMFACLFLGCSYIPIEGNYPSKRLEAIIKNSHVAACLLNHIDHLHFPHADTNLLIFDLNPFTEEENIDAENFFQSINCKQEHAFTFYTSGTTGTPKGVMITHKNALNFITWAKTCFQVNCSDRIAAISPLHFDLSIFDIFVTLSAGATLFLASDSFKIFPVMFSSWLNAHKISIIYLVPTALIQLAKKGKWSPEQSYLRLILFAGEPYPLADLHILRSLFPEIRIANLYGPTETNVCTWYEVPSALELQSLSALPIGKPINNVQAYLIDQLGNPVTAMGAEGELYCVGESVSPGYVKNGGLETNHSKFFQDPHYGNGFKTGDWVRLSPQGFVFLSRIDQQIKHRGYRIDIHEIEACIRKHAAVIDAAIIYSNDSLIAYVASEHNSIQNELAQICQEYLPSYMLPSEYRFIPAIPKTATEKTNYHALKSDTPYFLVGGTQECKI